MKRIYLGYTVQSTGVKGEIFRSEHTPTFSTHGNVYNCVVGPFNTVRGATFMRDHGQGNPHCRCVSEAERLGRLYAN
jgi:hypothetical protein